MINTISNANVYLDGNKLAGKIEELELPAIKQKMQEVTALGIYGTTEVPVGLEIMEAKFKWKGIYPENWKTISPFKATRMIVKSNMQSCSAEGVVKNSPVSVVLSGVFKELPLGSIKPGEKQDGLESLMSVNYIKLEVDGEIIQEIDIFNNIYNVGEEDVLASFNKNQ